MTEARLKLLVYKFLSENLTNKEKVELYTAAEEHPEIWDLIRKLQDTEQLLKDLGEMQAEMDAAENDPTKKQAKIMLYCTDWRFIAAAACILAAVILGYCYYPPHRQKSPGRLALQRSRSPAVEYRTDRSERGQYKKIVLPDSSHVMLSSLSSIRYPTTFAGSKRTVWIKGEAYFDIVKDPGHPFEVNTDRLSISVLGTRFDIRAYANEPQIRTLVTDGAVKVLFNGKEQDLHRNEQLIVTTSNYNCQVDRNVDTSAFTTWTKGNFRFVHADIATVARELGSWYGVYFDIRVPPTTYAIDGPFSHSLSLSQMLQVLKRNNFHFEMAGDKGDTIIVR